MKYLGVDNRNPGGRNFTLTAQWIEVSDDRQTVYRWINFTETEVYRGRNLEGIPASKCSYSSYPIEVSADKFETIFQVGAKGNLSD